MQNRTMRYSNNRILTSKNINPHQLHKDKTLHISDLSLILSIFQRKKTGCITEIHPVFELSQARGEVINILLINTGTVYVALIFWFVVNANTFCFMTIVVSTRNTIHTEVVKTNIL